MALTHAQARRNAQATDNAAAVTNGRLRVRNAGNEDLAVFTLPAITAVAEVVTISAAGVSDVTGEAGPTDRTADNAIFQQSDGTTLVWTADNLTTTGGGGDLELNTLTIAAGVNCSVTTDITYTASP